MLRLALRSLRLRSGAFAASFLTLFLGAAVVMAFASMLDTAGGAHVDSDSRETLGNMAMIVGGWGLIIVAFAAASTLGLSVRQRSREMALLRQAGATPGQIGRLIAGEAVLLALAAVVAALLPAAGLGALLLELLKGTDQVAGAVDFRFGPAAIGTGLAVTVVAATLAAAITARRANRDHATDATAAAAAAGDGRMSRTRVIGACLLLAVALDLAIVTAIVMKGEGIDAMQTGGQASIWASIGLALLAPALVRKVTVPIAAVLERRAGAGGYLAVQNLRRSGHRTAGVLMPVILFTGIATGTLYLQAIENGAPAVAGSGITPAEARNIETLNLVVVGMIAVFAAVMLVNMLVSATAHRRAEFARERLAGATPDQVLRMVGVEGGALAVTGIAFGTLGAAFTVIPYSVARTGTILPDASIAIYLAVVAAAAVLTLASALVTARRTLAVPAVQAAAPAAA